MGIFQDMVEVVVRVATPCELRYDGQDMVLDPNYTETGERIKDVRNMIPRQCIPYVLGQNPIMGSENPLDPSSFLSKVGIVDPKETKNPKRRKSWHDCSFIDERGAADDPISKMSRVNLREFLEDDPQVKDIVVRGRKPTNEVKLPAIENGGTLAPRGRG